MKTRIVAGLVASLALLGSASADAAPKKHGAKHPPGSASVTTSATPTAAPGTSTADAAPKPAHKAKARKKKRHAAATQPASLTTKAPASKHASKVAKASATQPASLITKAPASKRASKVAKASATQPASLITKAAASKPATRHATRPAALITPDEASSGAVDKPHHDGAPAHLAPPKLSRFLASGVPLAEIHDGRIKSVASARHPCGTKSRWARKNSEWTGLDEWGQAVPNGGATIADSRFYDGSGCYEVQLKTACTVDEAARVYVARGSGYSAGASARWNAEAAVVKRFDRLYAAQASAWVEGAAADKVSDEARGRTLFFSLPKQEGSVEGAATQRRPTHWAVAGGRVLVVGYVSAAGAWKVGHVLPPNGKEHAYEPLAILDMNGDGLPEIVVHEESGGVYVDRVLSFDPGTMRWEKAVESPGGATN